MQLDDLIARTLARAAPPEIAAMAGHVRGERRDVVAVLAYGSCLRGVNTADSLIDLYVLTGGMHGVSNNVLSRLACALVPPNVYYAEMEFGGRTLRAKYAVLPMPLFARWMTADNPYFWARFSQPSALLFGEPQEIIGAIAAAIATMYAHAKGLSVSSDPLQIWTEGFAATYATELRAESTARAVQLVAADEGYYREAAAGLGHLAPISANWPLRRFKGKLWSMARLAKAAFTFTGGADYIAWKIERHSGHRIELSAWQRRHPVIAGLLLLPHLWRKGAVR